MDHLHRLINCPGIIIIIIILLLLLLLLLLLVIKTVIHRVMFLLVANITGQPAADLELSGMIVVLD